MKLVIWGTGRTARLLEDYIKKENEIVAYVDNEKSLWGGQKLKHQIGKLQLCSRKS